MSDFWQGFYFGAGFVASQLIFVLIMVFILGTPLLIYYARKTWQRSKTMKLDIPEAHL